MVASRRFLGRAFRQNKRLITLCFVLLTLVSINTSPLFHNLETWCLESLGTLLVFVERTKLSLKTDYLYPEKAVIEQLRQENLTLRTQIAHFYALAEENAFLKKQLTFTQTLSHTTVTAPLLTRPHVGESFLIQGGTKQGIRKGQPVVVSYGLVGRIDAVSENTARVIPVTHVKSRVPVVNIKNQEHAILLGDGSRRPRLFYASDQEKRVPGETFVTSSYGGGFPPGLLVGCTQSKGRVMRLAPFVSWSKLEYVHVMTGFSGDAVKH
jgi:rod shape-determining protein MreC